MKNRKCRVDVAQYGARMHYAVPKILAKNGLLNTMYTDFYFGNKKVIQFILKKLNFNYTLIKIVQGREAGNVDPKNVVSFDLLGFKRWFSFRSKMGVKEHALMTIKCNQEYNHSIIEKMTDETDVVYAFNTNAVEVFNYAKVKGIKTVLEQCSSPKIIEQEILNEELKEWNEITNSIYVDLKHPYIKREYEEWNNADLILAPSQFVLDGLQKVGVPASKCVIVPYGVDIDKYKYIKRLRKKREKLNIFFAGEVGLMKGVHYLLEAIKILPKDMCNIKLAGKVTLKNSYVKSFENKIDFLGKVPRTDMRELYEWADLFVFPSLCEGSATVIYEAIASGLPVITTANAGSLIEDNYDGIIVPIRNSEILAEKIELLYSDIALYNKLSEGISANRQKASIDNYEKFLIPAIQGVCIDE